MSGLDCLGRVEIGADPMDIAKMFGGLLSGTGGLLNGGSKKGGDDKTAAADQHRLEDEKRKAEQEAFTMKMVALGVGASALLGAVYLLKVRK